MVREIPGRSRTVIPPYAPPSVVRTLPRHYTDLGWSGGFPGEKGSLSLSHQDSCQESCRRVMMTRAAAMIAVMAAGPGGDSLQGPEVLEHGIGPFGRGPHGGQRVVAGLLVGGRAGVLRGYEDADPGALVPLVGQDRHPQPCGPVQGGQHVESGRGQVVGGAGLHRTGVDRESGDNPSPPARCPRTPSPCPNTTDDGPCPGCAGATRSVRIRVPSRLAFGSFDARSRSRTSGRSGARSAITPRASCRYR